MVREVEMRSIKAAIALLLVPAFTFACAHQAPAATVGKKYSPAAPTKDRLSESSKQAFDPDVYRIGDVSEFFPEFQRNGEPCSAPTVRVCTDGGCACALSVLPAPHSLAQTGGKPHPQRGQWYFAQVGDVSAHDVYPYCNDESVLPRVTYGCLSFGKSHWLGEQFLLNLDQPFGTATVATVFGQYAVRISNRVTQHEMSINVPFKMPEQGVLLGVFIDDPFNQQRPPLDSADKGSTFVIWGILDESAVPPAPPKPKPPKPVIAPPGGVADLDQETVEEESPPAPPSPVPQKSP
jgi:hypothetical protein